VNDCDVAVATVLLLGSAVTPTPFPTELPAPAEQPVALVGGPQTKKLTIPVGLPPVALPVTVAWSVFDSPSVRVEKPRVVEVFELAAVTVKHSALLPSEDGV
jgi:hypothetical protein